MISWHDALEMSRKRWKRKHIFSGIKHSVPLFLLLLLSIVTGNIIYILAERGYETSIDRRYPHPAHIRVIVDSRDKEIPPLKPSQIESIKKHQAVRGSMAIISSIPNIFADFGETRYAQMKELGGYDRKFFDLYRTLPADKTDPEAVPLLLGQDLLALSWSPEKRRFIRDEQKEMKRWLGRTFRIYLAPYGLVFSDQKHDASTADYNAFRKTLIKSWRERLVELERNSPELARRQDPLFINVQVAGFIRDPDLGGTSSIIPHEAMELIFDLSDLRRDRKRIHKADENPRIITLLIDPAKKTELADTAKKQGMKILDPRDSGMFGLIFKAIRDESDLQITLGVMLFIYFTVMLVIVYQLLSSQVKDSIREIGVLRCIGAQRRDILRVFAVMNLVRLGRIYLLCIATSMAILAVAGIWLSGPLNMIKPETLAKGNIPDFLITRVDHFSPLWLMAPWWVWLTPVLLLVPIALFAAALPVWRVMRVQPSEALKD